MEGSARTPRYVLRDSQGPLGPTVMQSPHQTITAIFGFSGKPTYDLFLRQSGLALTPYPLVSGFLQRQSELDADVCRLIVLDASQPTQATFQAATVQAILESFNGKHDFVEVSHELRLDEATGIYRAASLAPSAKLKPIS